MKGSEVGLIGWALVLLCCSVVLCAEVECQFDDVCNSCVAVGTSAAVVAAIAVGAAVVAVAGRSKDAAVKAAASCSSSRGRACSSSSSLSGGGSNATLEDECNISVLGLALA